MLIINYYTEILFIHKIHNFLPLFATVKLIYYETQLARVPVQTFTRRLKLINTQIKQVIHKLNKKI